MQSKSQESEKAIALYQQALTAIDQDRSDEALKLVNEALADSPKFFHALMLRGMLVFDRMEYENALTDFDAAIALKPDPALRIKRIFLLGHMDRHDQAISDCNTWIKELDPDNTQEILPILNAKASIYENLGETEQALSLLKQGLEQSRKLHPAGDPYLLYRCAHLLSDQKRYEEAKGYLQNILEHHRQYADQLPDFNSMLMRCYLYTCDFTGRDEKVERVKQGIMQGGSDFNPFNILAYIDDPALIRKANEAHSQKFFGVYKPLYQHSKPKPGKQRIKVAYLSADLQSHATAYLMAEVFEQHRRERYEVHAYSLGQCAPDDPMRQRLRKAFEHFHDVSAYPNPQNIAEEMYANGIDVLIDLKGHTADARLAVLALRPAPVTATHLGFPATTGCSFIDYVIADHTVIPAGDEQYYTEKVLRLPHSYQPNDRKRKIDPHCPSRDYYGLPKDHFVFCCFNNNYKISEKDFSIWMRLLHAMPQSVLWLLADNAEAKSNLQKNAQALGIAPNRLIFAPRESLDRHLARHIHADLFLDTELYNAHTTASDALWAGLPVLTRSGKTFSSRVAASLLKACDLEEMIAANDRDYEEKALFYAHNPQALRAIKDKMLGNRLTCPLFDSKRFTRNMEAAIDAMYQRYAQGLTPDHIDISES